MIDRIDRALPLRAALVASGIAALVILRYARNRAVKDPPKSSRSLTVTAGKRRTSFYSTHFADVVRERVVIAMVGLPARGKSYMSKAVIRYFNFLGVRCKLFNAGNKRRDQGKAGADAGFFDPGNKGAQALKEQMAMDTLDDLLTWLQSSDNRGLAVGIFDATNTTQARRLAVIERCAAESPPVTLLFLESICNDEEVLANNYRMKLSNEDYVGADAQKALDDFLLRVRAYEKVYESITDLEVDDVASHAPLSATGSPLPPLRYIQVVDAGKKLVSSQLDVDLIVSKWLLPLVSAIHLSPRKVSIVLAGESLNDKQGVRGGDSKLSEDGYSYAQAVMASVKARASPERPAPVVLAGTLHRYEQMAALSSGFSTQHLPFSQLNELCFGALEGLQAGLLRESFPEEFAARAADTLNYRYPGVGGQSYYDVIMRMQSVLITIESSRRDLVVICDVAVARVLLGYFEGTPLAKIPEIKVQSGIVELTRSHSGFTRTDISIDKGRTSMLGRQAGIEFTGPARPTGATA